jgi:hypothetical protein
MLRWVGVRGVRIHQGEVLKWMEARSDFQLVMIKINQWCVILEMDRPLPKCKHGSKMTISDKPCAILSLTSKGMWRVQVTC